MSETVNVVGVARGKEQYIFVFNDRTRTDALRILGRFAADPDLSFTWFDAAVLSQQIRSMPRTGDRPCDESC